MAKRGSTKALSVAHEDHISWLYRGLRSPSSGGAVTDRGDVRTLDHLIECKMTGTYEKPKRSISLKLDDIEKIADEAQQEGKLWALAIRFYAPGSPVANKDGFVDVTVRSTREDAEREP